jgi:hypothetical protein
MNWRDEYGKRGTRALAAMALKICEELNSILKLEAEEMVIRTETSKSKNRNQGRHLPCSDPERHQASGTEQPLAAQSAGSKPRGTAGKRNLEYNINEYAREENRCIL